jgi:hypothetical protein
MIAWLKLDPEVWVPMAYGDRLTANYEHAKLVRPIGGVTQGHLDWVLADLVPNVCVTPTAVPAWTLYEAPKEGPLMERNEIWR